MKILTFYFHLRHIYDISLLGAEIHIWYTTSESIPGWELGVNWILGGVEIPDNIKFINFTDDDYDLSIVTSVEELDLVKSMFPDLPCIFLTGRGISGNEEIFSHCDRLAAVVGCSHSNMAGSPHNNTRVIQRPVFPDRYKRYETTLNIPMILIVINDLFYRTDIELGLMQRIMRGGDDKGIKPHIWVGRYNQAIPNGIDQVDEDVLMPLYGNMRLLLYWPQPMYSGFGNIVLEAMTMGMPVALNGFADWPDLIENGVNGFCSGNTIKTREFCERCLNDKEYALKVGAAGRDLVMEYFKLDTYIEQWNDLLQEVTS